ncbi:hypothetical protein [Bacillus massiliglaciei]|uniref:hypothetical protein n=1 Tax=Bacillus massiliglaciei TaxID=1816693 RepID=UPI0018FE03C8|nr:hypothetical protein [Bacillus massiliglaciei]
MEHITLGSRRFFSSDQYHIKLQSDQSLTAESLKNKIIIQLIGENGFIVTVINKTGCDFYKITHTIIKIEAAKLQLYSIPYKASAKKKAVSERNKLSYVHEMTNPQAQYKTDFTHNPAVYKMYDDEGCSMDQEFPSLEEVFRFVMDNGNIQMNKN